MPKDTNKKTTYHKPTSEEINEIIKGTISENTRKATAKWVGILEAWHSEVRYNYDVETIINKNQLEREMIEFILGIHKVCDQGEYSPSSLMNCIRLLSVYILRV
ncbi:11417_t:CDS:1, partial [Cetraspora pellucida]